MKYLILLLLAGCAQTPYWVKTHEPVAHVATITVNVPCGLPDVMGCAARSTGTVELKRSMTEAQRWCVLNHEKKHLAGYSHPRAYKGIAYDCGNGEIL